MGPHLPGRVKESSSWISISGFVFKVVWYSFSDAGMKANAPVIPNDAVIAIKGVAARMVLLSKGIKIYAVVRIKGYVAINTYSIKRSFIALNMPAIRLNIKRTKSTEEI